MTRRFAGFFLCGAVLSGVAFADNALPKAETVLDRFVEVTGGKAAYEKRKSEVMTGMVEMTAQNVKGTLTRYSAPPDKAYTVMNLEGVGKLEEGSASGVAWENNPMTGPRVKDGEEKAQSLREAVFNGPLNWRQLYSKAETAGVETIDGEECYKVVLTPATGKPETTYYQKKSGLAVRTVTTATTPMGDFPVEQDLSDYKTFDGVLMPTKMIEKLGPQQIQITINSVKANQDLSADQFNPPADVKLLMDKK